MGRLGVGFFLNKTKPCGVKWFGANYPFYEKNSLTIIHSVANI